MIDHLSLVLIFVRQSFIKGFVILLYHGVFRKSQPAKYAYVCECRSVVEGSTRSTSSCSIKMAARAGGKGGQVRACKP